MFWVILHGLPILHVVHGIDGFMSDLKAKVIMVKYLAQGDKHRDQPGQDGNPHSENSALHKLVTTFHYIHPSMWNIILSHNNFAVDSSFAVELYEVH